MTIVNSVNDVNCSNELPLNELKDIFNRALKAHEESKKILFEVAEEIGKRTNLDAKLLLVLRSPI